MRLRSRAHEIAVLVLLLCSAAKLPGKKTAVDFLIKTKPLVWRYFAHVL